MGNDLPDAFFILFLFILDPRWEENLPTINHHQHTSPTSLYPLYLILKSAYLWQYNVLSDTLFKARWANDSLHVRTRLRSGMPTGRCKGGRIPSFPCPVFNVTF